MKTHLKSAVKDAMSCACRVHNVCHRRSPRDVGVMRSTNHLQMVSLDGWKEGSRGMMKSLCDFLSPSVLLRYHFNALTGHHNLSLY